MRTLASAALVVAASLASGCTATPDMAPLPALVLHACAVAALDSDGDGLSDACELRLADAFAPTLMVSRSACNLVEGDRLGGGYFFVVQPRPGGARIGYLPAYFRDCAWRGAKCRLPGINCAPHAGDSEFIAIDVDRSEESWRVAAVFLSAHCFGRSSEDCRWYTGKDLRVFDRSAARPGPVVWVAQGRNANYPSRQACERGHMFVDTCDAGALAYLFPVGAARNIGSRREPFQYGGVARGCARSEHVDPAGSATAAGAVECLWDPAARFRGWQAAGDGVTPYEHYLRIVGGM